MMKFNRKNMVVKNREMEIMESFYSQLVIFKNSKINIDSNPFDASKVLAIKPQQ